MRLRACILAIPVLLTACAAPPSPRTILIPAPDAPVEAPTAAAPLRQPVFAPGAINAEVTQQNLASTICSRGWTATIRPPVSYTNRLKLAQMPLYGYPAETDPRTIREDHREPLEIGGAPRDPANLWPEPRREAQAKDRLETAVKRDVCAGRLTLQQGQAIFFGDFWREYDRRFSMR